MKASIRSLLTNVLNRFDYDVVLRQNRTEFPYDFSAEEIATCRRVQPYTMTDPAAVVSLIRAIEHIVRTQVPGAIVECGVWKGGSMLAAALTLNRLKEVRDLYLYDTFDGMPAGGEADLDWHGVTSESRHAEAGAEWCRAQIDVVRDTIQLAAYRGNVQFVQGLVEETIPATIPEQIALLRLDTDYYSSTLHEFQHLYPRLSPGGVVIVDDYGHWQGSRQATDEFLAALPGPVFLHRVNAAVRLFVKPQAG